MTEQSPGTESREPVRVGRLFVFWFALILLVKWPALFEPPIWDAAFGLFPAAGELADSGFNLVRLLQLPTYHQGGPNCHAESVVTWLTALVLGALGKGPESFVILHLLHFATAAVTLAVLQQFIAENLGRIEAWAISAATFACPLFSVQTGAMYFEIPLAACAVGALTAYAKGRIGSALIWSCLAVLVKQVGVIVPAVLIVAVILRRESWWKRIAMIAGLAVPAGLVAGLPLIGTPILKAAASPIVHDNWWSFMTLNHMPYLKAIPDIATAFGVLIIVSIFFAPGIWRSLREACPQSTSTPQRNANPADTGARAALFFSLACLQMLAFAGFFFVVPFFGRLDFYCLPRYFVFLLPMLAFGLAYAMSVTTSRRVAVAGMIVTSIWFVLNRDGTWYPPAQRNNGAMAERSESCRWLAAIQQDATRSIARVPAENLVLYGLPEHYFLHHPWMGYAEKPHPGGRCVTLTLERPQSLKLDDLPDRFYVMVDAVILGGRELRAIVREAKADPTRHVRVIGNYVREPYQVSLYEISRVHPQQDETIARRN